MSSRILEEPINAEMEQEFKPFFIEDKTPDLDSGVEESNKHVLPSEKKDKPILSIYIEQLKDIPLLSVETERSICREIKKGEKEVEAEIVHWFDLVENHLKLRGGLLTVKPGTHNSFSFTSRYSDNEGYRLKGTLLQLEKINVLKKERGRIKSILNSNKKIPDLGDWREVKQKSEIEIARLISQIKLDDKKIRRVLLQLEMEVTGLGNNTVSWKKNVKDLEGILNSINERLRTIRRKKNELIKSHLTLVIHTAKRYSSREMDFLDLVQEGNQGLIRAVDTFDYRRGYRFISYAIWWVRQSIIRAIHNQSRTMRVPVYLFDRLNSYLSVSERLSQEKGREPTVKELAGEMKISVEYIKELTQVFRLPQPLEDYVLFQTEEKKGNGNHPSVFEMTIQSDLKGKVDYFLADLSPRESEVIRLRFGMNGKPYEHSLQEIGRKFNLSRERIRQIEKSALIKLRKMDRIQELRDFLN